MAAIRVHIFAGGGTVALRPAAVRRATPRGAGTAVPTAIPAPKAGRPRGIAKDHTTTKNAWHRETGPAAAGATVPQQGEPT